MSTLLELRNITKSFGGLTALNRVSFQMTQGELIGLIGPNGSGKTTLLNVLTGYLLPDRGEVLFEGSRIDGLQPHQLAKRGIVRMFQLTRIFGRLSTLDNLVAAGCGAGLPLEEAYQRAEGLLSALGLMELRDENASNLSGGQQKLLEFGCLFTGAPRLVVLDEPFAAIHPSMREIMVKTIRKAHAEGQAVLIVSHDLPLVTELCDRLILMNAGEVLVDGTPEEVLHDDRVVEAYIGGK